EGGGQVYFHEILPKSGENLAVRENVRAIPPPLPRAASARRFPYADLREPLPDERKRRPIARAGENAWQLRGEFDIERNLLVGLHGLAERNTDHRPVVVVVVIGMNEFDLRGQVFASCYLHL